MIRTAFAILALCMISYSLAHAQAEPLPDLRAAGLPPAHAIWLDSLDLSKMSTGWGKAIAGKNIVGSPISLAGVVYPHGVGSHAISEFDVALHGDALRFISMIGIDDEAKPKGSAIFEVYIDGKLKYKSPVMHGGDTPRLCDVSLKGAKSLILRVSDAGDGIDYDHADWAGAMIVLSDNAKRLPNAVTISMAPPRMVIPILSPKPEIHSPRIVGATPGRPFIFLIPATGQPPLTYKALDLPKGLHLNPKTGVISGSLRKAGSTIVKLTVQCPRGVAHGLLDIVGGSRKLALTPPMGWNSWYTYATDVTEDEMKAATRVLIESGLASHGYQYINIDDGWEDSRDANGNIRANSKFPDMKGLADYIHSFGLKFGIYSSPGPKTCGGFEGSYQHELQDAKTYASWGVDFLKYDWCSYDGVVHGDHSLATLEKPYAVMRSALNKVDRDIVFSFCQYGMGDVWKWGRKTGGNMWRTNGDLQDVWSELLIRIRQMALINRYGKPGGWNDPDMLSVGDFWGHPSRLTPNEQILQFTMWSMSSAPLLIGGGILHMTPFTKALLTNDEVIAINQDPLGVAAKRVYDKDGLSVWVRPLYDGTKAVALVNTRFAPAVIKATWSEIGVKGPQPIRDLWLHNNVGERNGSYSAMTPSHGCVLLKIGHPRRSIP